MTVLLHGIPNCDTVKKARTWLESNGVAYTFHDFKKQGVSDAMLRGWLEQVPLSVLLNRKGTTWRALSDADKARADDADGAIALMQANPSLIKRPVLQHGNKVSVGFAADQYAALFTA
ncbi:Spx/MgsR family transcriptional regulator [Cupriavidus gilardii J11]|uniref:Spx/MgsR family transcriptional regulator n=1 Tax=Cupriavidus gilardii J11 TaxID=936133 RepID=A0A562B3T0_9BURK|nr:ArsC family reductase [Cupriavidus gilardii]TWG79709.1 Spx/MgsR family transcriptional regulator [Cupriavidus gilardii J11]